MEFPDLGKHCANPNCKQLDFLPVVCDACSEVFCISHFKYEDHSCPKSYLRDNQVPICPLCNKPVPLRKGDSPDLRVNQHIEDDCQDGRALKKRNTIYKNRCSFEKCKKKELIPITCDRCRLNYCLKHRHPLDHQCSSNQSNNKQKSHSGERSLSKAASAALRRFESATSNKKTVNNSAQQIKSIQGDYGEDEALAQALQQSIYEQSGLGSSKSGINGTTSLTDDQLLAEALERSQRENTRNSRDKCSVA